MPAAAPILGNIAINLIAGVGLSVLSSLIAPANTSPQISQTEQQRGISFDVEVGEALPIRAVWGLARATHQFTYKNEYGNNNEYLQLVYRVGMGEHDGLEKFLVDEKVEALEGANSDPKGYVVTSKKVGGTPYMWVKYYTGAAGQAADAELVARANPSGRWTSAHKLTGWAYLIVTMRYNEDLFGNTIPQFGSVWRGLKLFDWRNPACIWGDPSTYVFSKNPPVQAFNFRRGVFVNGVRVMGMGYSAYANDLAYFTAAANRCDETFYDPETDTSFPIFEYGRRIGDDEDKLAVLKEFEAAWSGSSFKRGGAYAPLVAQQLTSVMTLTEKDRHQKIDGSFYPKQADLKGSVSTKKTLWHGQFVSEANGWALSPFATRINTSFRSVLGGDRAQVLDQPYESNQARAQMRAEIALRRQFYPATRTETFGPKAMVLEPGDLVTIECDWGSMPMVVESADRLDDMTGVELALSQWNNAIVPVSGESFVTIPSDVGTASAGPSRTLAVSGLLVEAYQRTGGGSEHPFGKASWTHIDDPNVDQVMIRVWPSAGTEANDSEDFFASARLTDLLVFGPLQPVTEYTGWVIPIRSDGRTCVKANITPFTTGDEVTSTEILPGSITAAMLGSELSNINGVVVGDGPESISAALDNLEQRIAEQAAANALSSATNKVKTDVLRATSGANTAAIITEQRVRASADEANASLTNQAIAALGGTTGTALFNLDVTVDGAASTAIGVWKVKAQAEDAFATAGIILKAVADGMGGTTSSVLLDADQIFITNDGGETVAAFFQAGTSYLDLAVIKNADITGVKIGYAEIDTLNIKGNAVTVAASVDTAGIVAVSPGASATIATLDFTPVNGVVLVKASCFVISSSPSTSVVVSVELKKNGTTVAVAGGITGSGGTLYIPVFYQDDSPGTSTATWTLQGVNAGSSPNDARFQIRHIDSLNAKK